MTNEQKLTKIIERSSGGQEDASTRNGTEVQG